jgi:hypothetical protein
MWGEASRWDRKVGVSFKRGPESWEDLQERARKCEGHASKLTTGTCYEFFFMFRSQITFFILFLLVGSQGFATKKIIPRLTTLKTILEPF